MKFIEMQKENISRMMMHSSLISKFLVRFLCIYFFSIEKQKRVDQYYKDCWHDFLKRFNLYRKEMVNFKEVKYWYLSI